MSVRSYIASIKTVEQVQQDQSQWTVSQLTCDNCSLLCDEFFGALQLRLENTNTEKSISSNPDKRSKDDDDDDDDDNESSLNKQIKSPHRPAESDRTARAAALRSSAPRTASLKARASALVNALSVLHDESTMEFAYLPIELLLIISDMLDPIDIARLRSTCRRLYRTLEQRVAFVHCRPVSLASFRPRW